MSALEWRSAPWTAVEQAIAQDPVFLLPVGAMEAHGPHLSNDADTVIATAVARRAAALLEAEGERVVILPAVECSVCEAAAPFPGTISYPAEVVSAVIAGTCREVVRHGGRRFVVNVHHWDPPHLAAVDAAVREVAGWEGVACVAFDRRSLSDADVAERFREGEGTGVRHGGRVETAMVLAEQPDHVAEQALGGLAPVWVNLMPALRAGARDFREAGASDAYFGDPANAGAEEGDAMLEHLARGVAELARALDGR